MNQGRHEDEIEINVERLLLLLLLPDRRREFQLPIRMQVSPLSLYSPELRRGKRKASVSFWGPQLFIIHDNYRYSLTHRSVSDGHT